MDFSYLYGGFFDFYSRGSPMQYPSGYPKNRALVVLGAQWGDEGKVRSTPRIDMVWSQLICAEEFRAKSWMSSAKMSTSSRDVKAARMQAILSRYYTNQMSLSELENLRVCSLTPQVGSSVYKFHLLPSGLVHEHTTCVIGNGVVIHLPSFFNEIDDMEHPTDGGTPLKVEGILPAILK